MRRYLALLTTILVTTGCAMPNSAENQNINLLNDQTFILRQVDDSFPPHSGRQPMIKLWDNGEIRGVMCNHFSGQGTFSGQTLIVPILASTKMLCSPDQLNRWEIQLADNLARGVQVSLKNGQLTLRGPTHTFIYGQQ